MMRSISRKIVLSCALFCMAELHCGVAGNQVAGGVDFPNSRSVAAVGTSIVDGLQSTSGWNELSGVPDSLPALGETDTLLDYSVITGSGGMAKQLAPRIDSSWDSSDIGAGLMYLIVTRQRPLRGLTIIDTITWLYNDRFRDTIEGNEQHIMLRGSKQSVQTGLTLTYATADSDTDGVWDRSEQTRSRPEADGRRSVLVIHISGGADNALATRDDNYIHYWERTIYDSADTAAYSRFTDYDGDGLLFRMGTDDSGMVRFIRLDRGTGATRAAVRQDMVLVYFHARPRSSYILKFHCRTVSPAPDTIEVLIGGGAADSTVVYGASGFIRRTTRLARGATIRVLFSIITPADPGAPDNARLSSFVMERHDPAWPLDPLILSCTPAEPLAGSEPVERGRFSLTATDTAGVELTVTGTITDSTITGEYADDGGAAGSIVWERDGTVLQNPWRR